MRVRTFTVPFAKVVGDDNAELEFGPDDYIVVRPLFAMPAAELRQWTKRIGDLQRLLNSPLPDDGKDAEEASRDEASGQLIVDVMGACIVEWHLADDKGEVPRPLTVGELDALPAVLKGSLFNFLTEYRGDGPNPTARS